MAFVDTNQKINQAAELGIELRAWETGGYEKGGLIEPLYEFKFDGLSDKYGNDIEGVCKFIKRHNRADKVTYTDEGDHYKIHAVYKYSAYVSKHYVMKIAECDLNLSKDYFNK